MPGHYRTASLITGKRRSDPRSGYFPRSAKFLQTHKISFAELEILRQIALHAMKL
jgi:hypothetical protein